MALYTLEHCKHFFFCLNGAEFSSVRNSIFKLNCNSRHVWTFYLLYQWETQLFPGHCLHKRTVQMFIDALTVGTEALSILFRYRWPISLLCQMIEQSGQIYISNRFKFNCMWLWIRRKFIQLVDGHALWPNPKSPVNCWIKSRKKNYIH